MTFEEAFTDVPGDGWLTEKEARLLWDTAKRTVGPILEVGCYKGRSTCLLARLGRPVLAVDPFSGFDSDDIGGGQIYELWKQNVYGRKLDNVQLFKTKVESWSHFRQCGFAYLDGDHTRAGTIRQVIAAAKCHVEEFCVHDYATSGGGLQVKLALEDCGVTVMEVVGTMARCRL